MRRARITYPGAFHHVMNRGHGGKAIFYKSSYKRHFLTTLTEQSKRYRIKLLVYSIMDTHYHLILQNSSGKLSDFMRQLNGTYGRTYRHYKGGKGYVFQGRFKSLLVQEGSYLTMASVYVLNNCVAAGIVEDPFEYKWSSIGEYFTGRKSEVVDSGLMEEVFGNREQLEQLLREWSHKELPIKTTRYGKILGENQYINVAKKRFDRRKDRQQSKRMRIKDYIFESPEDIIREFQKKHGIGIDEINTGNREGKRLRSKLLVLLKDRAGLSYQEIIEYPLFKSLKYCSLGQIYRRAKRRILEKR